MKDEVVKFIYAYSADYGYPPTYREIGEACGLKSKSVVKKVLDELQREGRIDREPRLARTVRVL